MKLTKNALALIWAISASSPALAHDPISLTAQQQQEYVARCLDEKTKGNLDCNSFEVSQKVIEEVTDKKTQTSYFKVFEEQARDFSPKVQKRIDDFNKNNQ